MSYRDLTLEEVSSKVRYDEETGKFYWIVDISRNIKSGAEAGCVKATRTSKDGKKTSYLYVKLGETAISGAQLAWFMSCGEWPIGRVFFRDGDTLNLALNNLEMSNAIETKFDHSNGDDRKAYLKEHREAHPLVWKNSYLQQKFGIGLGEYGQMLVEQGGKCAICGEVETQTRGGAVKALAVDHHHGTGKLRGLLCSDCNTGLGKLKDDREVLLKAVAYLDKHAGEPPPSKGD